MKKIDIKDFNVNAYTKFAKEWTLISAGSSLEDYNTMTASWGHIGCLWGHGGPRATVVIYIRPQRYTKKFVDENDYFSLSFFNEEYRNDLNYLGSHSGKDENKVSKTSLTPLFDNRTVYFKQANTVLICRKLYAQEIKEDCFTDKNVVNDCYPKKDFHTMYVAEIEEILVNQ